MPVRFIYALSNPLNQQSFYVGCTENIKNRRRQHVKKYSNQFNGLPPVFTIIDTIEGNGFWVGLALERYWINKYKSEGAQLVNRRGMVDENFNVSYSNYRDGISKANVLNYRSIKNTPTNL